MNNNRRRNFRLRPQKNNFRRRSGPINPNGTNNLNGNGNLNFNRNGSMNNIHNVEKTMQKYQQLAKDAQSNGDPVLSQNYLQHADHFSRILSVQEINKVESHNNNIIEQDFKKEVEILNEHKEHYFITKSSRLDPSNRLLKWKLLFPKNIHLPFLMTYFNIDPKPKNFIHPNGIKRINKVSYRIDNSLIPIFKQLCDDKTIQLINEKGAINVSFKK